MGCWLWRIARRHSSPALSRLEQKIAATTAAAGRQAGARIQGIAGSDAATLTPSSYPLSTTPPEKKQHLPRRLLLLVRDHQDGHRPRRWAADRARHGPTSPSATTLTWSPPLRPPRPPGEPHPQRRRATIHRGPPLPPRAGRRPPRALDPAGLWRAGVGAGAGAV